MRSERRRMMVDSLGLPHSYERLEYIENTSTAYIDCGLEPKYTFSYEIKSNALTPNSVFGCKFLNDNYDYRFFCVKDERLLYFDVGSDRLMSPKKVEVPYHVKFGNYYIENLANGTKVTGSTFGETMNNAEVSNLLLFSGYGAIKGKCWLLNINDGGKPVRDFIPAKRKADGVIGMYDMVGRKFYTSPNGIAFSGGGKV